MERNKFLKSIGSGAAFAVTFGCLGGCLREELDPLDITDPVAETPIVDERSIGITETAPEPTPEPTIESAPEPTPDITPAPAPEPTPEPISETATEPSPELAPEPTPESAPEPTPEPTPDPLPEPGPEPAPEPEPVPEPAPANPPSNALFTIDLKSSEASKLRNKGGYIIKNKIVVAKNLSGDYVAATVICSHDLLKKMVFKNNEYYCTEHSARFDQKGKGLNSKGKRGLKIYKTSLNGNALSILA